MAKKYVVRVPKYDTTWAQRPTGKRYTGKSATTFARIGSASGEPREVWEIDSSGRRKLVRRYSGGEATYRAPGWKAKNLGSIHLARR